MKPEPLLPPTVNPLPAQPLIVAPDLGSQSQARRQFFRAPQSVAGFLATVLDPVVIVSTLWTLHLARDPSFSRWVTALSLMVIALTFPGRTRLDRSCLRLAADVAGNWVVLMGILLLCGVVTRSGGDVNWVVLQQWALVTPVLLWLSACALRAALRWQSRRGAAVRPVVLVGACALAQRTAQAVRQLDGPRRRVVGCFDDRDGPRISLDADTPRLGSLNDVARYVDKLGIREVYITLPMASQPRMASLLDALQGTTASLYFVPDVLGTHVVQGRLQDVNGLPVVGICESPFTGINELVKRCSDVLLAAVLLLISAPVMVLVAVALRLEAAGPVLDRQRRCGLDGEEITVFKFRTVAPRAAEPAAVAELPTRVGAWLRRFSLHGLPQLLNVLQGRLSMVGPRPHAMAHSTQYRQQIKGYMVRHKARPGITGWAQIRGRRGDDESVQALSQRLDYDLEYLRNWSLGLDVRILLQTLRLVLTGVRDRP